MARPLYDVCIKMKDGSDIEYTDHKGNKRTGKSVRVGAVWPRYGSDDPTPTGITFEKKVTIDPVKMYVNLYPTDRDAPRGGGPSAQRADDDDLPF